MDTIYLSSPFNHVLFASFLFFICGLLQLTVTLDKRQRRRSRQSRFFSLDIKKWLFFFFMPLPIPVHTYLHPSESLELDDLMVLVTLNGIFICICIGVFFLLSFVKALLFGGGQEGEGGGLQVVGTDYPERIGI